LRNPEIGIAVLNKNKTQIKFSSIWENLHKASNTRGKYKIKDTTFNFKLNNVSEYNISELCNSFFEIFIVYKIKLYNHKLELIDIFQKDKINQYNKYYFDFRSKTIFKNYQKYLQENKMLLRLLMLKVLGTDLCYQKDNSFKTHMNDHFIEYRIIFLYKVSHFFKINKILPTFIRNIIKSILSYVKDDKIDAIHRL
tara:strand:- start:1187 stop:1774 length:588 start_codon:yes stop_codon:yes gene_type:complete